MPKIPGWDKKNKRRWEKKADPKDTAALFVVTVKDRRNMNRDHNWAAVHTIIRESGRRDKTTIKKANTKEKAMEAAKKFMRRNPD